MGQSTKRRYIDSIVKNKTEVLLTMYGQNHIRCYIVRRLGNTINIKRAASVSQWGLDNATTSSVCITDVHTVEEL